MVNKTPTAIRARKRPEAKAAVPEKALPKELALPKEARAKIKIPHGFIIPSKRPLEPGEIDEASRGAAET